MRLDNVTEMAFTRLSWREKLAVLHIELWHALRRLARLEHRYYLVLDGKPVAKFTAAEDHRNVLDWFTVSHQRATDFGMAIGKEHRVAQHLAENGGIWEGFYSEADAGDPGSA